MLWEHIRYRLVPIIPNPDQQIHQLFSLSSRKVPLLRHSLSQPLFKDLTVAIELDYIPSIRIPGFYIVCVIFINYEKEIFDVIKVTVAHVVILDFSISSPIVYTFGICGPLIKSACRTELAE